MLSYIEKIASHCSNYIKEKKVKELITKNQTKKELKVIIVSHN